MIIVIFASLIIRTFQLVFSAGTVFFSYNKSVGTMFRLVFQRSERGQYTCRNRNPKATRALPESPKDPNLCHSHCLKDLTRICNIKNAQCVPRKKNIVKSSPKGKFQ